MAWAPWAGHWLGTKEVSLGLGFFICDIPAHLAFLGVKRRKEEKWGQEGEPRKDSPAESKPRSLQHPGTPLLRAGTAWARHGGDFLYKWGSVPREAEEMAQGHKGVRRGEEGWDLST